MMDLSEPLLLEKGSDDFLVFFEEGGNVNYKMVWRGSVYPVYKMASGYSYISNESSDMEDDKLKARCMFEFSFVWRGVWEGRVYPKDDEYWSEELRTISEVWLEIENILKERIKADNPDYKFYE